MVFGCTVLSVALVVEPRQKGAVYPKQTTPEGPAPDGPRLLGPVTCPGPTPHAHTHPWTPEAQAPEAQDPAAAADVRARARAPPHESHVLRARIAASHRTPARARRYLDLADAFAQAVMELVHPPGLSPTPRVRSGPEKGAPHPDPTDNSPENHPFLTRPGPGSRPRSSRQRRSGSSLARDVDPPRVGPLTSGGSRAPRSQPRLGARRGPRLLHGSFVTDESRSTSC